MKKILALTSAAFLGMQAFATTGNAAIVDAPVAAEDFLTLDGADWAWAGPCAPFQPSCGAIDLSFQGPQGWAVATSQQIDAVLSFVGGLDAFVDLFDTGLTGGVCASRFFSNQHQHCDYRDGRTGYIENYSAGNGVNSANEVFAIRVATVPVPAAGLLMLAGLGGLGAARRRKSKG